MTSRPDSSRVLSETKLCEIAGVNRTRRRSWAAKGLLRHASDRGRYGELDAAELVSLRALISDLDYEDAVMAWEGIRPTLKGVVMAEKQLAVVDLQAKTGLLVTDPSEVGQAVLHGHPFRVIDLTDLIGEVCETYRRLRAASGDRESSASGSAKRRSA